VLGSQPVDQILRRVADKVHEDLEPIRWQITLGANRPKDEFNVKAGVIVNHAAEREAGGD
jgi:hypothetical protein